MSTERQLTTRDWIGFVAMIFGMFMSILDIQIVASSLETIQSGLSASRDETSWIQTSYLIAEVIMIPLSGWLSRAYSTRVLFAVACGGFTLMSLACACAWNINAMIVFRMLQGFFGGAMIPTVFAVIFTMFPKRLQPNITVLVGLVVTIAPTIGPVIGGYLSENISWHFLFTMNIIPGILVTTFVWLFVHVDEPDPSLLKNIDFPGIFYIWMFLGPLEFVLEEGNRKDWFSSNIIISFSMISILGCILMFRRELTTPHPIVDFRAFKNANFAIGSILSFILGCGLYTVTFLLPSYLGMVKELNSMQIGFYMMVAGGFQFLSAPIAGILSKKMDLRFVLAIGLVLFGTGTWLNGFMSNDTGYLELFLPQAVRGASLMLCFLPINSITFATLDAASIKNASGLYNLMRNLGGAIGLASASACLTNWQKANYAVLRESVNSSNQAAQQMFGGLQARLADYPLESPDLATIEMITGLAQREATILTFNTLFHCLALLFFFTLLIMPLLKPARAGGAPSDAH